MCQFDPDPRDQSAQLPTVTDATAWREPPRDELPDDALDVARTARVSSDTPPVVLQMDAPLARFGH